MNYGNMLDEYIIDIVQKNIIREQSDLQKILKLQGCHVPQATLSRHLKKLKIAKVDGLYKIIDFSQHNLPLVLNLQTSEAGLIVMYTHPGQANSLAYFIDRKYLSYTSNNTSTTGILGTIAGDDTVLVITRSQEALKDALGVIYQDFPYLHRGAE